MADPTLKPDSGNPFTSVPVEITISVGKARPLIGDLLNMNENSVLALDKRVDDPVELYVGDKLIARGELEEMEGGQEGQLAVRLTEVAEFESRLG
ncbi:FliM/FliN family flagellar motor C-terminal domain-containing protein [Shimia sagamensis]|uniref:Flagellar motor switch protein FliN n=1 Tax=Shimia sagamensis TaxID=1566352 RepID=A0ABY1NEI1_9RHOB|nr:FliM/FliN family flagellar motor C-terminal domain-containing protein [Shimia sagamensis]SMP07598.1 flagellar motor switch protein FliN/FliY [Shimia sagamensis]